MYNSTSTGTRTSTATRHKLHNTEKGKVVATRWTRVVAPDGLVGVLRVRRNRRFVLGTLCSRGAGGASPRGR